MPVCTAGPPGLERGQVAQLVEQRIENPRVAGSIPALATERVPSAADTARCRRSACAAYGRTPPRLPWQRLVSTTAGTRSIGCLLRGTCGGSLRGAPPASPASDRGSFGFAGRRIGGLVWLDRDIGVHVRHAAGDWHVVRRGMGLSLLRRSGASRSVASVLLRVCCMRDVVRSLLPFLALVHVVACGVGSVATAGTTLATHLRTRARSFRRPTVAPSLALQGSCGQNTVSEAQQACDVDSDCAVVYVGDFCACGPCTPLPEHAGERGALRHRGPLRRGPLRRERVRLRRAGSGPVRRRPVRVRWLADGGTPISADASGPVTFDAGGPVAVDASNPLSATRAPRSRSTTRAAAAST